MFGVYPYTKWCPANPYPYHSSGWENKMHDLNLDWLVKKVDKNEADIKILQQGGVDIIYATNTEIDSMFIGG